MTASVSVSIRIPQDLLAQLDMIAPIKKNGTPNRSRMILEFVQRGLDFISRGMTWSDSSQTDSLEESQTASQNSQTASPDCQTKPPKVSDNRIAEIRRQVAQQVQIQLEIQQQVRQELEQLYSSSSSEITELRQEVAQIKSTLEARQPDLAEPKEQPEDSGEMSVEFEAPSVFPASKVSESQSPESYPGDRNSSDDSSQQATSSSPPSRLKSSKVSQCQSRSVAIPSDEEILEIIRGLDRQFRTDNYLPIFHLRERLQPPLSREELDRALYRLERNDLIELSALQEVRAYTPEQIDAGIPQNVGGHLFFIMTVD